MSAERQAHIMFSLGMANLGFLELAYLVAKRLWED